MRPKIVSLGHGAYAVRMSEDLLVEGKDESPDSDPLDLKRATLVARAEDMHQALVDLLPLIRSFTIGELSDRGGASALHAFGLNPWAMNEGLATHDTPAPTQWLTDLLDEIENPREPEAEALPDDGKPKPKFKPGDLVCLNSFKHRHGTILGKCPDVPGFRGLVFYDVAWHDDCSAYCEDVLEIFPDDE